MRKVWVIVMVGILYKALPAQFEQFSLTAPFLFYPAFSAAVLNDTIWVNIDAIPDTLRDTLGNPVGIILLFIQGYSILQIIKHLGIPLIFLYLDTSFMKILMKIL